MVRLRYLGHNLEVPEGEFFIGRSSRCQLSIDDALVSRQHASLIVSGSTATIEDLGSRNGVVINGKRIPTRTELADGDTITIGSQSMTIHGLSTTSTREVAPDTTPRRAELQTIQGSFDFDEPTADRTAVGQTPFRPNADRRVNELSLVGSVAEKALAMGRPEDANRLLERPLSDVLARSHLKEAIDPSVVSRAAQLAIKLAAAMNRGDWVEYVLELYTARGEVMPQAAVDELYTILRKTRIDGGKLRSYLKALKPIESSLAPNERFQLSRIEGLEPLVGLK
ncbi:MAG: FHA domain-containing protein [Polyangiaceae bacterium]